MVTEPAELVLRGRRSTPFDRGAASSTAPADPTGTADEMVAELIARRGEIIIRAVQMVGEEWSAAAVPGCSVDDDVLAAAVASRVDAALTALGADLLPVPRAGAVIVLPLPSRQPELPAPLTAAIVRAARAAVLFHAASGASELPDARAAADAMVVVAERLAAGEEEPPHQQESAAVIAQRRRSATLRAIIDHDIETDEAAIVAGAEVGHDFALAVGIVAFTAAAEGARTPPQRRVELAGRFFADRASDALPLPLRLDGVPHAAFLIEERAWPFSIELAAQVAATYRACAVVVDPAASVVGLRNRERTAAILLTLAHERGAEPGVVRECHHLLDVLLRSVAADAGVAFVDSVLGPVLRLAPSRAEPLLDTLRELLAMRGGFAAAAHRLGVHRETVKYRMGRLTELTGFSLADPVQRTHLDVALRLVAVPRHRG